MSDNSDSGIGCAVIILGVICLCVYPFYDGYASRSLPKAEATRVTCHANAEARGGKTLIWVTISNDSEWFVDMRTVNVLLASPEGVVVSPGKLVADKGTATEVSPGGVAGGYFRVNADAERLFLSGKPVRLAATVAKGHPRPIKLAKEIVDRISGAAEWFKGLFERA